MTPQRKLVMALFGAGVLLVTCYQVWRWGNAKETRLFALDAETGRVVWSLPRPMRVGPGADLGRVFLYAPGKSRDTWQLTAHDAATGRLLWAYSLGRNLPIDRLRVAASGKATCS